ncbi:hypothetical protein D9619_007334 [Psilocybe cf. subviscida]|uniref:U4/U6 snRNA-associated-splicing factor PRP24 n=1 Tax=Psilocybe cf. subviscida TaxID=2480587 RepID=A0A8H5EWM2_9AGAR|nr:hypothetical protein D9619_007334 [Psilocybe cf. subviscida]
MLPRSGNSSRNGSPMRSGFSGSASYRVDNASIADGLHPVIHAGRVAVITGAASGIGRAAALEFAKLSLKIAIADVEADKLAAVGKEVAKIVGDANVLVVPTDVANLEQVVKLRDRVYEAWGEVAVLMNNAGIGAKGTSWAGIDNWRKVFDVNMFGIVNVQQTFVPSMIHQENPAAIINTGSKQGITNPPGNAAYNASKAAVKSLTEGLAHELREQANCNVTAHLFIPGWTFTGITGAGPGVEKPTGAWSAEETVLYMIDKVREGEFYILVPDNETRRQVDQLRIMWAAADIAEGRPALSRWHKDYKALYEEYIRDGLAALDLEVAENPYDANVHAQHIRIAQSLDGMESEVTSAREMMTQFLAAGDDVWLPLLAAKENTVDLETAEGVEELLTLYARAESDYLSIPILQRHLNFLVEKHALYTTGEQLKAEALGDIFSTSWSREAIEDVVSKGAGHLMESAKLWDVQRDWEQEALEAASPEEKPALVESIQNQYLARLAQPHPSIEETFQAYSTFTTNYLPAQDYESLLVAASKIKGQSIRNLSRREAMENAIIKGGNPLNDYVKYIGYERRAKYPDVFVTRGVYERAIADAAKRRFAGEPGAEEALHVFWAGYCDALRILDAGIDVELAVLRRAVRSVPASGEVWARYIRFLERVDEAPEDLETVPDIFDRAIATKVVQKDIDQLAPLILARGGYEKRNLEIGKGGDDTLPTLIGVVETGIALAYQASKTIDPKLRLEKFVTTIYESTGLVESVFEIWKAASKHSKSSYQVWLNYTDALIKHQRYADARKVFTDIHTKNLDWPEVVWEAWTAFEHLHGSVDDIEFCLDKIEGAQYQTNMRRAKEAAAAYVDMQMAVQEQVPAIPTEAPVAHGAPATTTDADVGMQVDEPSQQRASSKRKAEEEPESDTHKKAKVEQKPPPLKRDRENSTVFVADLPADTTETDLKELFKDCGSVREVKTIQLPTALVATVEFFDRDSVPAALTKDKKRLHDEEISVHLAWRSTLYITNFPESADDASMRDLFGKYGTIFDVRWPSKKFKTTRRFCYIQYTSPHAAEKALELHGRELEPNLPLNVYVSNPERRKERTDQDANEREVYVAGLSRFTNKGDLEKLFATYGSVKDVRIALEDNGHAKGFAFIEFEDPQDAQKALAANNHELKKRRIAVTLADPRVKARHKSDTGLSRVAEARNRSVRIKNLPPATQEGLLQQALEKVAPVKRVEVFIDKLEAVVELENPADAGRLLLRTEPITFGGNTLELSEDVPSARSAGFSSQSDSASVFKPRRVGGPKPKAGLGFKKGPVVVNRAEGSTAPAASAQSTTAKPGGGKGQDDFRKMLEKAQFSRRDAVFYNSMPVKSQDAFLIICNITSTPVKPPAPPAIPRQPVPKSLLDTFGSLLDDPRYSDVLFVIPKRGKSLNQGDKIWAAKRVLERAEYFHTMLNSTFSEGVNELDHPNQTPRSMNQRLRKSPPQLNLLLDEFEDSDDESEETDQESPAMNDFLMKSGPVDTSLILSDSTHSTAEWDQVEPETPSEDGYTPTPVTPTSSAPQRSSTPVYTSENPRTTVVVKDAAYITYRAMLYYVTISGKLHGLSFLIVFAPLSSSFLGASDGRSGAAISAPDSLPSTPSEGSQISGGKQPVNAQDACLSRAEWIRAWMNENPGRPAPCSAKSIYRIADRLDLSELKEKAEKFITKSLTVENIAYEVFSPFAAAFESIRKVEIEFFLSHWHEIRTSNTMKNVWVQIRNGRHPGFEDVWPLIVQNLDFRPSDPEPTPTKSKFMEGWP